MFASRSDYKCDLLSVLKSPSRRLYALWTILLLGQLVASAPENRSFTPGSSEHNESGRGEPRPPLDPIFAVQRNAQFTSRSIFDQQSKPKNELRTSVHRADSPNKSCHNVLMRDRDGSISSPGYPGWRSNVSSQINCSWTFLSARDSDILTLSFDDLHLAANNECQSPDPQNLSRTSCCSNSLEITSRAAGQSGRLESDLLFCGGNVEPLIERPFISIGDEVKLVFSTMTGNSIRGFHATYTITQAKSAICKSSEFHCANGKCVPEMWRCNRKDECGDSSDEVGCGDVCAAVTDVRCDPRSDESVRSPGCFSFPADRCDDKWDCDDGADEKGCSGCPKNMFSCRSGNSCFSASRRCDGVPDCVDFTDEINCGLCGSNHILCDAAGSLTQCYDPLRDRCNGQINCPNAVDEVGCRSCGSKILCASGFGCYDVGERCNGIPDCPDYSDEKNCSTEICRPEYGSFLCANKRCIRSNWVCDRSNDCGDATDEINCLKNSVITAAIMGSLVCGLLLVIAISCTCKLIALRQVEDSEELDRPDVPNQNSEQHLFRLEPDSFFFREPPPSYSAAVCSSSTAPFDSADRRRIRRVRRQRRRPPSPPSDTPTALSRLTGEAALLSNQRSADQFSTADHCGQSTSGNEQLVLSAGDKAVEETIKSDGEEGSRLTRASDPETQSLVNIELDSISSVLPSTQCECDQEPLLP